MAVSLQQAGVEVDPVAGDVDSHADITNHLKKVDQIMLTKNLLQDADFIIEKAKLINNSSHLSKTVSFLISLFCFLRNNF